VYTSTRVESTSVDRFTKDRNISIMFIQTSLIVAIMASTVMSQDKPLSIFTYTGINCRGAGTGVIELESICTTAGNSQSILVESLPHNGCYAEVYVSDGCIGESNQQSLHVGSCYTGSGFSGISIECSTFTD
jgi:hypothetical protein